MGVQSRATVSRLSGSTALKGSEQNWLGFAGSAVNPNPGYVYMGEWFRYFPPTA